MLSRLRFEELVNVTNGNIMRVPVSEGLNNARGVQHYLDKRVNGHPVFMPRAFYDAMPADKKAAFKRGRHEVFRTESKPKAAATLAEHFASADAGERDAFISLLAAQLGARAAAESVPVTSAPDAKAKGGKS